MLESGFARNPLSWLLPSPSVEALTPVAGAPVDLKDQVCGKHRRRPAAEDEDDTADGNGEASNEPAAGDNNSQLSFMLSALRAAPVKNANLLSDLGPVVPVVVYTGPTRPPGWQPPPSPARKRAAANKNKRAEAKPKPGAELKRAGKPKAAQ